ncbi:MAG TPA: hypothetical protein VJH33_02820 [Candidatus Paceibacterota bacterium]
MGARPVATVAIDMSKAKITLRFKVTKGARSSEDTLSVSAYDKTDPEAEHPIAVVVMNREQWDETRSSGDEMMKALALLDPQDIYT